VQFWITAFTNGTNAVTLVIHCRNSARQSCSSCTRSCKTTRCGVRGFFGKVPSSMTYKTLFRTCMFGNWRAIRRRQVLIAGRIDLSWMCSCERTNVSYWFEQQSLFEYLPRTPNLKPLLLNTNALLVLYISLTFVNLMHWCVCFIKL